MRSASPRPSFFPVRLAGQGPRSPSRSRFRESGPGACGGAGRAGDGCPGRALSAAAGAAGSVCGPSGSGHILLRPSWVLSLAGAGCAAVVAAGVGRLRHRPPPGPPAAGTTRHAPRAPGEDSRPGREALCQMGLAGRVRHPRHRLGHGQGAAVSIRLVESPGLPRLDGVGGSQRLRGGTAHHGHHTGHDIAVLVIGLGAGTLVTVAAARRHRRRTARPVRAPASGPSDDPT